MANRRHPATFATRVRLRPRVSGGVSVAAVVIGLCAPVLAQAQDPSGPRGGSIQVEEHAGSGDPFGDYGLAVVYDRGGRFSGGLGLGLYALKREIMPPVGFFGRVRLLRWGFGSLGLGAALSREHVHVERFVGQDWSSWTWNPAYRASGTVGVEVAKGAWSLRLDAGIGYLLGGGQCTAMSGLTASVSAGCDSPEIPAAVRTASQDARLIPSLTATIGYRFPAASWPSTPAIDVAPGTKLPETALHLSLWSTLAPTLAGAALLYAGVARSNDTSLVLAGVATMALGLSFGPSIGYAYADEPLRAWGGGALRLLTLGAGILETFTSSVQDENTYQEDLFGEAFGIFLVSAAVFSAVYDVSAAPDAARRANARNGLTNLSLAPAAIPGRGSTSPGLLLAGRF
jgi:hypothetical protein